IAIVEAQGHPERFIFGFEESYGYLSGTYVRDKDAVVGSMLIVEMASWYKQKGMTLVDALNDLYKRFGLYCESVANFQFEGAEGMKKMGPLWTACVLIR
ncbi:phospho-sugar mutase, partial [Anaerotruncus colihominis]|nr:phospho-sugar mutase [Anaerotruncus colihominis]